jgi:hypothetical protein
MMEASPNPAVGLYRIAFETFGVRVGVATNDEEIASRIATIVPPYSRPCDRDEVEHHFSVVTNDGAMFNVRYDVRDGVPAHAFQAESYVVSNADPELALGLLDTHVHGVVAFRAPDHVFIGAGVVGFEGRAIVMPGMALSGKTTLVAALVRAGCVYYSDQYAVIDEQGRVHPYPRRQWPHTSQPTDHHDLATSVAGEAPLTVGAVVSTSYWPGAEWRPRPLSRGDGLLALLSHAVAAQHRTQQVMHAINLALDQEPTMIASDRDEADAVTSRLLAEVGRTLPRPA